MPRAFLKRPCTRPFGKNFAVYYYVYLESTKGSCKKIACLTRFLLEIPATATFQKGAKRNYEPFMLAPIEKAK